MVVLTRGIVSSTRIADTANMELTVGVQTSVQITGEIGRKTKMG